MVTRAVKSNLLKIFQKNRSVKINLHSYRYINIISLNLPKLSGDCRSDYFNKTIVILNPLAFTLAKIDSLNSASLRFPVIGQNNLKKICGSVISPSNNAQIFSYSNQMHRIIGLKINFEFTQMFFNGTFTVWRNPFFPQHFFHLFLRNAQR